MTPREERFGAKLVFWVCYLLGALPFGGLLVAFGLAGHGPTRAIIYGAALVLAPLIGYRRILTALLQVK